MSRNLTSCKKIRQVTLTPYSIRGILRPLPSVLLIQIIFCTPCANFDHFFPGRCCAIQLAYVSYASLSSHL